MKKIMIMAAFIFAGYFATAQQMDTIPKMIKDSAMQKMKPGKPSWYITMQAGQVMMIKDGKAAKLAADKSLNDGTIVTTDGKVKKADGTTVMMKEGDRIYMEGRMKMSGNDQ